MSEIEKSRTSGMAIASFVLGLVCMCIWPTAILGLIFGVVALRQIKKSEGLLGGRGLALAGTILSTIGLLIMIVIFFILPEFAIPIILMGFDDSGMTTIESTEEVEIAPDKWLTIGSGAMVYKSDLIPQKNPHELSLTDAIMQFLDTSEARGDEEESSLALEWNGKRVNWRGPEIPITLREYNGTLYMVGFNREDVFATRLVFFKLKKRGNGFRKIAAEDFPKQIATQNMWLTERYARVGPEGKEVDLLQMLRTLNVKSLAFSGEFTAYMWFHLVNDDVEYHEIAQSDIDKDFLREYKEKYNPIALPTIVRLPDVKRESLQGK